ncbi:Uncharacterised protein [Streptococcus merionis]|uniref:Uncharacterized protein n=1 Tax=Streptococcus merionis TaxID=400065 RepID=A0A239SUG9_9STRE|nr:Uncharacterised protein [Streptococcus merionis]
MRALPLYYYHFIMSKKEIQMQYFNIAIKNFKALTIYLAMVLVRFSMIIGALKLLKLINIKQAT